MMERMVKVWSLWEWYRGFSIIAYYYDYVLRFHPFRCIDELLPVSEPVEVVGRYPSGFV